MTQPAPVTNLAQVDRLFAEAFRRLEAQEARKFPATPAVAAPAGGLARDRLWLHYIQNPLASGSLVKPLYLSATTYESEGSIVTASVGGFDIATAGLVAVTAFCTFTTGVGTYTKTFQFSSVVGPAFADHNQTIGTDTETLPIAGTWWCPAGETLDFRIFQNSGADVTATWDIGVQFLGAV